MEAEDRFARQIKKGILEMLVLELLSRSPGYGYALLTRLAQAPGGSLQIKEGTLYPILYRLEEEGLLRSDWQTGPGRAAPKKIYTITPQGIQRLGEEQRLWKQFLGDVQYIENWEDVQ